MLYCVLTPYQVPPPAANILRLSYTISLMEVLKTCDKEENVLLVIVEKNGGQHSLEK